MPVKNVRFVTPEQFDDILRVARAPPPKKKVSFGNAARCAPFAWWFDLVLRTLFATGCRPSEIVGRNGREGRTEEEGHVGPPVTFTKEHHGLRARDVLEHHRLFIEGKHTNGRSRTRDLKPRTILCADPATWRELRALAEKRMAEGKGDGNLFGLGSGKPDGWVLLKCEVKKLRRRVNPILAEFTPRWLRHSHAIAAIRSGIDLVSIQRQLGHEDLATTAIYLRFAGMDERRYLLAFGGGGDGGQEEHDCPSCGFAWKVEKRTGALAFDARMGVALRRRVVA